MNPTHSCGKVCRWTKASMYCRRPALWLIDLSSRCYGLRAMRCWKRAKSIGTRRPAKNKLNTHCTTCGNSKRGFRLSSYSRLLSPKDDLSQFEIQVPNISCLITSHVCTSRQQIFEKISKYPKILQYQAVFTWTNTNSLILYEFEFYGHLLQSIPLCI